MKKITLTTAVIFFTLLQTKAQQENHAIVFADNSLQKSSLFNLGEVSSGILTYAHYNGPTKDYDYYTRKKKSNLTAGILTLGAGLALSGIGWAVASNSKSFDDDETAGILLIAGAVSGIVSIPLMIMATVYGHKAKIAFNDQKTGFGVPKGVSKNITGITLSIPIGK